MPLPNYKGSSQRIIFAFLSSSSLLWYGFSLLYPKGKKKREKAFANKRIPYTPSNASDDGQLYSWSLFSMGSHTH